MTMKSVRPADTIIALCSLYRGEASAETDTLCSLGKTTPALRATPPPEGNFVRDDKNKRAIGAQHCSLLSALCSLLFAL